MVVACSRLRKLETVCTAERIESVYIEKDRQEGNKKKRARETKREKE